MKRRGSDQKVCDNVNRMVCSRFAFVNTELSGSVCLTPRRDPSVCSLTALPRQTLYLLLCIQLSSNHLITDQLVDIKRLTATEINDLIDNAVDHFNDGKDAEYEAAVRAALQNRVSRWQEIYCLALLWIRWQSCYLGFCVVGNGIELCQEIYAQILHKFRDCRCTFIPRL